MNNEHDIKDLNQFCKGTLISHLDIEFYLDEDGEFCAKMPVTKNHMQPMGIMHGGASMVLAETVGSAYSFILTQDDNVNVVGQSILGNHLNPVVGGIVYAKCRTIHLGKRTHVIDINISDEEGKEVSACRLTNMIIQK